MLNAHVARTVAGTAFALLSPHEGAPAPTLLLFAMGGTDTLTIEPYCRIGRLLHAQGWNVVSLDLPCHGADRRTGEPAELNGWQARLSRGEDIVVAFQQRVNEVIAHLIATGLADPSRIAAAGTSRGGFMAFQSAAGNPWIRAVAAFAPVTDLLALTEFAGQETNPVVQRLALIHAVEELADRAAWIVIGNADTRVGTDKAVAFARALTAARQPRSPACSITLRLRPIPGHTSLPEWHDEAASWVVQTLESIARTRQLESVSAETPDGAAVTNPEEKHI